MLGEPQACSLVVARPRWLGKDNGCYLTICAHQRSHITVPAAETK